VMAWSELISGFTRNISRSIAVKLCGRSDVESLVASFNFLD
jgi:hypothetical protein